MKKVKILNDRCHICDFTESGMCTNFEQDRFINNTKNYVFLDPKRNMIICLKCFKTLESCTHEHATSDKINEYRQKHSNLPWVAMLSDAQILLIIQQDELKEHHKRTMVDHGWKRDH